MGYTKWSDKDYSDRKDFRTATKTSTFAYSDDIYKGKIDAKVHDKLNPIGVIRESRDSDTNPNSKAVAVLFDVTGSMSKVPHILQKNLPSLMGLLLRQGYLENPHILIGGIGDATCDVAPLQVGQFESGIEIENDLTNLFLEAGGGGGLNESYELAMYFMANKTSIDCWEKRKQKGYCFIIGDEAPYSEVEPTLVKQYIGDNIQKLSTVDLVKQLITNFESYLRQRKSTTDPLPSSPKPRPKVMKIMLDPYVVV